MNRLTWYVHGESMEDILVQAGHVGIYDGDSKHTEFEQGTASLTLHRLIWADSADPSRRVVLQHSLVNSIEKHGKSMFSRSAKVYVRLDQPPCSAPAGPANHSMYNQLRFVFRNGGEDDFYRRYDEALRRKAWQRTSSGSSSSGSIMQPVPRLSQGQLRNVGVAGIEKRLNENHMRTNESITQAFEDMSRLMETAREMVGLSKSISEKLRVKKGDITDDETVAFKSYLLSLGVSDPVTKSSYGNGSKYFDKLAEELTTVLSEPLSECGGMMTLPEVYCRVNRARGMELLSPEDVLNACMALTKINSPLELHRFASGVLVVQLKSASVESTIDCTAEFVKNCAGVTTGDLAQALGITFVLAKERLLAAEEKAILCRDDSVEGLRFYPNRFVEL